MLLHQDAARRAWLAGRAPLDLVVTLDDATSTIYSALLVEEEGTASSLRALAEVIGDNGLFCALYTDRGSHYFHTPATGGRVGRRHPTQVGRALAQLGVEHVAAYSPQARGRSERAFRTLEDRLPKELALAGITGIDAANAWLRAVDVARGRFSSADRQTASSIVMQVLWAKYRSNGCAESPSQARRAALGSPAAPSPVPRLPARPAEP